MSDSDPSLPAQYNRIQTQVVQMIREKDLRMIMEDYSVSEHICTVITMA